MSNKQNKQQSAAEEVAEAVRVLDALKDERRALAAKAAELNEATARLAYGTHALHDPSSTKELSAVRADTQNVATQMREHDFAIVTAEQSLAQARQALDAEADVAHAHALRRAVSGFVDAGRRVDHALSLLARDGHALVEAHARLAELGCAFPSGTQLDALGHLCLRSAIMQTPWARSVETVPPNQRRSFRSLIDGWASNIEANNIRPRLGEQTTEAA
jgi:hypothetical protein